MIVFSKRCKIKSLNNRMKGRSPSKLISPKIVSFYADSKFLYSFGIDTTTNNAFYKVAKKLWSKPKELVDV